MGEQTWTHSPSLRIQKSRVDTKEGNCGSAGLRLDSTWEGRYDDGTCLGLPGGVHLAWEAHNDRDSVSCLPERVDNSTLVLPDMLIVPLPRLRIDRLSNTAQHSQTAQIVSLDVVLP